MLRIFAVTLYLPGTLIIGRPSLFKGVFRAAACRRGAARRGRELGMRVLLIEDDSATAQSIELMLKDEQC
jgi:hypothetical protein